MQVTFLSPCGQEVSGQIQGTKEAHRISFTTGAQTANGTIMQVSWEDGYGTDNVIVIPVQSSGYDLGRIEPQAQQGNYYELLINLPLAGTSPYVIDVITKEIL